MGEKVAIITAAGKGIGAAIARELAAVGYQLALMSNSGGAVKLAEALGGIGMQGSVTEPDDLKKLVDATIEKYGRIDAVVTNTGHPPKGDILAISDEDWHQGLELLILPVARMARLVTPIFEQQGSGAMVNISTFSDAGFGVAVGVEFGVACQSATKTTRNRKGGVRLEGRKGGDVDHRPAALLLEDGCD